MKRLLSVALFGVLSTQLGMAALGPVLVSGQDPENHGLTGPYTTLMQRVLDNVTNGKTGILVIGADPASTASTFISTVAANLNPPQTVTFLNTAPSINAAAILGAAPAIVYIPSSDTNVTGGISQAENTKLATAGPKAAVGLLYLGGSAIVSMTQDGFTDPYGWFPGSITIDQLGAGGAITGGDGVLNNLDPAMAGLNAGLTTSSVDAVSHNIFTAFPLTLQILAVANEPGSNVDNKVVILGSGFFTSVCPLSHGYWKGHAFPAGSTPMVLGNQEYSSSQILALLNANGGDASIILARQLIAAKLDASNGSTPVLMNLVALIADGALEQVGTLPANVDPTSSLGQGMTLLADVLDAYVNGKLQEGCAETVTPQ